MLLHPANSKRRPSIPFGSAINTNCHSCLSVFSKIRSFHRLLCRCSRLLALYRSSRSYYIRKMNFYDSPQITFVSKVCLREFF